VKLLDTSVAVDYLRRAEPAMALLDELAASKDDLVASELVRFELFAGARDSELPGIESFCAGLEWVPIGTEVAKVGGALARRYRPSHGGVEDVDYLIAATALLLDAELLTANVRHFPMLEGLRPAY
jgi:predicted nucleic acid-binding protein